jgi:hypothetical protein
MIGCRDFFLYQSIEIDPCPDNQYAGDRKIPEGAPLRFWVRRLFLRAG